jgi:hypothetical protein
MGRIGLAARQVSAGQATEMVVAKADAAVIEQAA